MVAIECDCQLFASLFLAVLLDEQSVEQKMKELEERFGNLVDQVNEELLDRKVDKNVHAFRSIFLSLNISRKYLHQKFIENNLKIDEETTFDNLWMKLTFYWNFLNFDLLEHVINKFGSEELKQKMESYKHDLQSFRKATRLCVFVNCWPLDSEIPETEIREFVTKIELDWENCTLEDIEKKKRVFIRKFLLPEYALQPGEMKKGCTAITWLVPKQFVKALQEDIETTNSEFFKKERIIAITIDGQECYPTPTRKPVDYPQPISKAASTATPPTIHPAYSQPPQLTPGPSPSTLVPRNPPSVTAHATPQHPSPSATAMTPYSHSTEKQHPPPSLISDHPTPPDLEVPSTTQLGAATTPPHSLAQENTGMNRIDGCCRV